MAIGNLKDVESGEITYGLEDLDEPLLNGKAVSFGGGEEEESGDEDDRSSIGMVLLSTAVAVCGSFEFGSCVGYSAPAQSAIREDLNLSLAEYSMFGSILTIGAMLGAVTSGRTADFIGRKGAMRLSAVFCIMGWLAIFFSTVDFSFSESSLSLDIGRFFTGYGIGVFSYVVPIFIAEIAPKNLRGGLTTLNQLMIVVGASTAFLLGSVITWRSLALTGELRNFTLFQAKVGREKEFQVALQRLRGKDTDITREALDIQLNLEALQNLPKARMVDLFQPKYIRSMIIGVALMVFQQFGGINGIGFYASETFASAGPSLAKIGTILYACIQVPITIAGAMLMDRSGRRPLIMVSATGTFLGCSMAGASFFFKSHGLLLDWVPILAVSGVLVYISAFSIGMGAVPWVIMSEIFPINMKGVGGSLVVLVNWLGAWAVSFTFNFLMSWSSSGTFFLYSGFSILTILFVAKFVPETKGKTLEEIQESINNS
ncbi:Sugar transporter ERD6-like 16 [Linum perenne]